MIQTTPRLSEAEASQIKQALLVAAEKGCQNMQGGVDPECLARGLIAAFRLVDEATCLSGSGPAGAAAV